LFFEEGKFDSNDSTNTYVQAGYTVSASSQLNSSYGSYEAFDGKTGNDVDNLSSYWVSGTLYLANTGIYNGVFKQVKPRILGVVNGYN